MRILQIVLFVFISVISNLSQAQSQVPESLAQPELGNVAQNRHFFVSRDGIRLSWVKFQTLSQSRPILILPGRGESASTYSDLVRDLAQRGHGPIYLLEFRNQGFSHPQEVRSFDDYVNDLFDFINGPLKQENISHINVLAHSMGSTVLNLAMQRRADWVDMIVNISPMFDLKAGRFSNAFNNLSAQAFAHFACFFACEQRQVPAENVNVLSLKWLKEAIAATRRVRPQKGESSSDTLIFAATRDRLVRKQKIYDYACASDRCSFIELDGDHALHMTGNGVYDILVDKVNEFFRRGEIAYFVPSECSKMLVKGRSPRTHLGAAVKPIFNP